MADPRFFRNKGPFSIADIALVTGCRIENQSDQSIIISDVASLDQAGADQISFFDNVKYKNAFINTKASACFIHEKMVEIAPEGMALFVSQHPYKAYAKCAQMFYPDEIEDQKTTISAHAVIDERAKILGNCRIDAGAVI